MNKIDCWPPKNGESSTAAQKYGERSTCDSSNRVIMLQGLDPNSTQGRIRKAFEDNGLKVTVDYQRDDTIGYVHLHLPMAKEVVHRITSSGGLRVGSEYVVLRALEGNQT
ncbi:16601_t:CDS:2 [Funneliformis mosseae]|uniref:16601_t:CDS:1 n=1 Tax=Funneliformis mosseae TaxID=27381 RepID=A0A9N9ED83_FUNMO|nr:16601_t:CDS:2 [Funneliformis mosseae]